jgi:hypothetical protein
MMAGYSGTPLAQKLGIREGTSVVVINGPSSFVETLGPLPDGAQISRNATRGDMFIVFAEQVAAMEDGFRVASGGIPPDGSAWLCWPKRASGIPTDITEQILRDLFLPTGMVDNKVIAVDKTWSGLRFVVRKENRAWWGGGSEREPMGE